MRAEIPARPKAALRAVPGVLTSRLEAWVGSTVDEIVELTQPWDTRTRTYLVSFERGDRVIIQSTGQRSSLARRLRIGRYLYRRAPWLPIPELLAADARAPLPFIVTSFVPGDSGSTLLTDDNQASLLGSRMGLLARDISRVPISGLRLSTMWSNASRLEVAARRWLDTATDALKPNLISRVNGILERLPVLFAGVEPRFAHGDFAPVNVIVRDGDVVALLDLERARIAHQLFDAAWFRCTVRHYHPERWDVVGPAFMSAAGVPEAPALATILDALAALQCLEMVDRSPASRGGVRSDWAARLAGIVSAV